MNGLISEDYLMHYGVKGMKWGVRHDPQPTGRMIRRASNSSYRQNVKAAGRRNIQAFKENYGSREARRAANQQFRNEVNAARQKSKEAFGLSNKQKKVLKGAAIAAGVAGAGAISIVALKSGAGQASISKGAKYLRMGKTDAKIMKIGVQDAIAKSKTVNKGKNTINKIINEAYDVPRRAGNAYRSYRYDAGKSINKARSSVARKARMARTDAKIVKIGAKDTANSIKNKTKNKYYWARANRATNKLTKSKKISVGDTAELRYWLSKIK